MVAEWSESPEAFQVLRHILVVKRLNIYIYEYKNLLIYSDTLRFAHEEKFYPSLLK